MVCHALSFWPLFLARSNASKEASLHRPVDVGCHHSCVQMSSGLCNLRQRIHCYNCMRIWANYCFFFVSRLPKTSSTALHTPRRTGLLSDRSEYTPQRATIGFDPL
jgi:hypothetical protein